jgi:hypothetical protein
MQFSALPVCQDGGTGGAGTEETSAVVADFNGDGKPDIAVGGVVGGSGPTGLSVLLKTTS